MKESEHLSSRLCVSPQSLQYCSRATKLQLFVAAGMDIGHMSLVAAPRITMDIRLVFHDLYPVLTWSSTYRALVLRTVAGALA